MIKTPEELKKAFANGAIPTEADFANLIDSFVHRDQSTDEELRTLREIIAWWRSSNPGQSPVPSVASVLPPTAVPPPAAPVVPAVPATALSVPAEPEAPANIAALDKVTVAADGKWYPLPVTTEKPGVWLCSATTGLDARPGYRITNTAIAVVEQGIKRLVQNVDRDSIFPWRTLQLAWQPMADSPLHQLYLRTRSAFGIDNNGKPTQIQYRITRQD